MEKGLAHFIVLGDTQRTSTLEKVFLKRESNDLEREYLFQAIARETPDFVVIVGDLVCNGYLKNEWSFFEKLAAGLRGSKIPIFPARGNHDANIEKYFKEFESASWFSRQINSVGLVWLDTTIRCKAQVEWFGKTLQNLDASSEIKHILTFAHHPPFTAGPVVAPSRYVKKSFVPAFQASRKTRAFISGHNHGFEKFELGGKHFIVTGGGGGPRHSSTLFPFHYLKIFEKNQKLHVEVLGLQKGERSVKSISAFSI